MSASSPSPNSPAANTDPPRPSSSSCAPDLQDGRPASTSSLATVVDSSSSPTNPPSGSASAAPQASRHAPSSEASAPFIQPSPSPGPKFVPLALALAQYEAERRSDIESVDHEHRPAPPAAEENGSKLDALTSLVRTEFESLRLQIDAHSATITARLDLNGSGQTVHTTDLLGMGEDETISTENVTAATPRSEAAGTRDADYASEFDPLLSASVDERSGAEIARLQAALDAEVEENARWQAKYDDYVSQTRGVQERLDAELARKYDEIGRLRQTVKQGKWERKGLQAKYDELAKGEKDGPAREAQIACERMAAEAKQWEAKHDIRAAAANEWQYKYERKEAELKLWQDSYEKKVAEAKEAHARAQEGKHWQAKYDKLRFKTGETA